jgi:hypothetical protein
MDDRNQQLNECIGDFFCTNKAKGSKEAIAYLWRMPPDFREPLNRYPLLAPEEAFPGNTGKQI